MAAELEAAVAAAVVEAVSLDRLEACFVGEHIDWAERYAPGVMEIKVSTLDRRVQVQVAYALVVDLADGLADAIFDRMDLEVQAL